MHQKYITEGMVLSKRGAGEAHTVVLVLTERLGLLRARAQSARRESSKLRYGLEPLTLGRYTFVQGKQEWRLTGADALSREFIHTTPAQRRRLGQVARLLLRLVLGAEYTPELYQTVHRGFETLSRTETNADAVECVLVLRILSHLGYLPELPSLAPFVESNAFTPELAAAALASRALLVKLINDSLQATGL